MTEEEPSTDKNYHILSLQEYDLLGPSSSSGGSPASLAQKKKRNHDDDSGDANPHQRLIQALERQYHGDVVSSQVAVESSSSIKQAISHAWKQAPATTCCRINQLVATSRDHVMQELRVALNPHSHQTNDGNKTTANAQEKHNDALFDIQAHPLLEDVVTVRRRPQPEQGFSAPSLWSMSQPPSNHRKRPNHAINSGNNRNGDDDSRPPFTTARRTQMGWPSSYRVVICDRLCGEAVLRGSNIFVRGILAADAGLVRGDVVAVYADTRHSNNGGKNSKGLARGMTVEGYHGTCVLIGMGTMACLHRKELFQKTQGVGINMSLHPQDRAGPILPPLSSSSVLLEKGHLMLQNLPSVLVGHVLVKNQFFQRRLHETRHQSSNTTTGSSMNHKMMILDMCSAPGGKAVHVASLLKNHLDDIVIVSCDKSRKKMMSAKALFDRMGASACIVPMIADSTKLLWQEEEPTSSPSAGPKCPPTNAQEVLDSIPIDESSGLYDGLAHKKSKSNHHHAGCQFPPESFDAIVLDPPCSALGLRPRLFVTQQRQENPHSHYQRRFVDAAVELLKPGGIMTYSTCSMMAAENEEMASYILSCHQRTMGSDSTGPPIIMELLDMEEHHCAGGNEGVGVLDDSNKNKFASLGRPGREGFGLSKEDCQKVRRFDPHTRFLEGADDEIQHPGDNDTIGFFVALFRKKDTSNRG